jgi:hypothetical protein
VVALGILALAAAVFAPPGAGAQPGPPPGSPRPAYALDIPEGWGTILGVGTEQRWIPPADPDPLHPAQFIRVTATADQRDVETYAAEMMRFERAGGAEIVDEGATTACEGQPAHHWIARGPANDGGRLEEHALVTRVTDGVGLVQYVRPQSMAARSDALATLASLCPAPFAMPQIGGWTGYPTTPAGVVVLRSPDGTSSFYGSYRRLKRERFPSNFHNDPRATVTKSWSETCTNGELIHTDESRDSKTFEVVWGYVRGYAYVFTYERLTARAPDPAAEAALSSICRSAPS